MTAPPRSAASRILSSFGTSILGVFSGLLTNLWLIRDITRQVPAAEFGIYALVLQITAYLGTLQLGLDFAASQRIAHRLGAGDDAGAAAAYNEVRRFNRRVVPFVALVVLLAAGGLWIGVPGIKQADARMAAKLALLTGAGQVTAFLSRASYAALVGSQRQTVTNLLTLITSFGTTVLAYALLQLGLGVYSIPSAFLAFSSFGAVALWFLSRRLCDFIGRPASADPSLIERLLAFGGFSTLGSLAWTVEVTSDVAVLGWFRGPSAVAAYVLWWRFPAMIFDLCTRLVLSAFPGFAERHGSSSGAGSLFDKVAVLSFGLASLAFVGLSWWLPPFMRLWVGSAYDLDEALAIAVLMGGLVALRTVGNLLSMFWVARGEARFTALLGVAQAMTKVAVGVPLCWVWGLPGLLVGSCIASALQVFGVNARLRREQQGLGKRYLAPGGVAVAAAGLAFVAAPRPGLPIGSFAAGVVVTAAACGSAWIAWAWTSPLRPNLESVVRRLRRGSVPPSASVDGNGGY